MHEVDPCHLRLLMANHVDSLPDAVHEPGDGVQRGTAAWTGADVPRCEYLGMLTSGRLENGWNGCTEDGSEFVSGTSSSTCRYPQGQLVR